MNKIRRSWLGRGSVMALVAAGLIGLGACSGSDDGLSQALEEALQERLDQALEDLDDLEDERDDALDERDDALKERDDARDDLQGEQQENQGLQEERDDLQEERDEAQQKLDRFVALEIVNAIPDTIPDRNSIPSVPSFLSYGEPVREPVLATATGATFTSTSTGSSGGWFTTTRSGSGEQRRDFVEIFSNVERPIREDIRDYSAREADEVPTGVTTQLPWNLTFDEQGRPTNHLDITTANAGTIATSSRFPRPSTQRQGEKETFTVTDRGPTQAQKNQANARKVVVDDLNSDDTPANDVVFADDPLYDDYRLPVRADRYLERYSIDISGIGMLQGARGTFRCAGTSETAGSGGSCTVNLSGPNNYVFANGAGVEWQFIPTSATSEVIIPDAEYMWFGWWKREPIETTPNDVNANAVFDYAANYGGTNQVTDFANATGTATYEGAAIGYYGFYDIEAAEDDRSRSGRFQAKATLTADFGDATDLGTISGSITEFDTEPTWSVTLKSQNIATGGNTGEVAPADDADDSVSWSIRGLPRDGGQWEAKFYSNFEDPADNSQPTGVAGAFTAQYGDHRKMIGSFGAERDN